MKTTISLDLEQVNEVYSALNNKAVYYFEMAEKQTTKAGKEFYNDLWNKVNDIQSKVYEAELRLKRKNVTV
jgi:hypothetical protein